MTVEVPFTLATDSDPDAIGHVAAVDLAPDGSIVFGGQSGNLTSVSAASRDLGRVPNITIETDTRTAILGRMMSGPGPGTTARTGFDSSRSRSPMRTSTGRWRRRWAGCT